MKANNLPCDDVTEIRSGHPLVTPVGSLIRRYKIDELPQLVNVLKGEMSLIGPRPTVPEQVDGFSPFEWRRQEILPGLTGWAQINGGIDITWPERIKLDVWYVDHRSAWIDISILLRTIPVVFGAIGQIPRS
jgi:lipopolysaccharide/colanic/teichoic acid biosynthesis glycosyltransferase